MLTTSATALFHNTIKPTTLRRFLPGLLLFVALALMPYTHWRPAQAAVTFAVITVNTTADTVAADGFCSLREALQAANTNAAVNECPAGTAGLDTIQFNLGMGTPTINVTSALPTITEPIVINGNTSGATRVELNGTAAGLNSNGLLVMANSTQLRSLVINRFNGNGILIQSASGIMVEDCYLVEQQRLLTDNKECIWHFQLPIT